MSHNIDPRYLPSYDPDSVQYMRDELIEVGFEEALTPDDVDNYLAQNDDQTVLLVINSVCGCAAGSARPGVALALQNERIPDRLVTSFAGQDKMAVEYIRQRFLSDYVPSSPCVVLFRNGEVLHILQRKDLVHKDPEEISDLLIEAFDKYCQRPGPSVDREHYDQLSFTIQCSSNLPKFNSN